MNIESIKSKLKSYSIKNKKIHQHTITRFLQERLLYRLSISDYRDHFLLKGGALVYVYGAEESRFTKDIDLLLSQMKSEENNLKNAFKEIAAIKVDDGILFDVESIISSQITKEDKYSGTRIRLEGKLGNIKQGLQIDIGVGDFVTPGPQEITYPTILSDFNNPILKAYSLETLIAEKFDAIINLGSYNSRLKDFYDIYKFIDGVDDSILGIAIKNTFERRETILIESPSAFERDFFLNKERVQQWNKFLNKNKLDHIEFIEVYNRIIPKLTALLTKQKQI